MGVVLWQEEEQELKLGVTAGFTTHILCNWDKIFNIGLAKVQISASHQGSTGLIRPVVVSQVDMQALSYKLSSLDVPLAINVSGGWRLETILSA